MSDLQDAVIGAHAWKNPIVTGIMVKICESALKAGYVWPDEVLLPDLAKEDANCTGIAWKSLTSKYCNVLAKTGNFRRSQSKASAGRTIFEYQLINPTLARAFLRKHGQAPKLGQMELIAA